jgi:hypothetical protein
MSLGALASRRRIENEPKELAGGTPALPGMRLRVEGALHDAMEFGVHASACSDVVAR